MDQLPADRRRPGHPETLEGARVYIATWDWNGVDREYRPLRPVAAQWIFGGGNQGDPIIIDDTEVIEVALDPRLVKDDPAGDDSGHAGLYTHPTDPAFGAQMDLRRASLVETADGLRLDLELGEVSDNQDAPNGFDQAMFHIYLDVPGEEGLTLLPFLNAQTPAGMAWDYAARLDGWYNQLFSAEGAAEDSYGTELGSPALTVDNESNTISLLFSPDPTGGIGIDASSTMSKCMWQPGIGMKKPAICEVSRPQVDCFEFGGRRRRAGPADPG